MPRPKNKIPKQQVKVWLAENVVAELSADAERFGLDSVPALIEEVLRLQYSAWRAQRIQYEEQSEKQITPGSVASTPQQAKIKSRSSV